MPTRRSTLAAVAAVLLVALSAALPAQAAPRTLRIGGYHFFPYSQPATCSGDVPLGVGTFAGFTKAQCAFVTFIVDGGGTTTADGMAPDLSPAPGFNVTFTDQDGGVHGPIAAVHDDGDTWRFNIDPLSTLLNAAPGTIRFAITSTSGDTLVGQPAFQFTLNALGTRTLLTQPYFAATDAGLPVEDLVVEGVTWERYNKASFVASDPTDAQPNPDLKPADVTVVLTRKDGTTVTKTTTAGATGLFTVTFTAAEIGNVSAPATDGYEAAIKITSTATYTDPVTDVWKTATVDTESTAHAIFRSPPTGPQMRTTFVSERGWVEPGETYIHAIDYRNISGSSANSVTITDVLPANAVYLGATPAPTSRSGNTLTWNIGTLASSGGTADLTSPRQSYTNQILVTARAKRGAENPRVVYQDLSNTATLTFSGGTGGSMSGKAHGPQVRMQEATRLGDRPFPVVLVDYSDFKHSPAANGWSFHYRLSSKENPASLYTHYQNMSYGQLYPQGDVTSFAAPDGATYAAGGPFKWSNPYLKGNTCTGGTLVPPDATGPSSTTFAPPGPRVNDGWYQLPGQRQYYGQDGKGTAIAPVGDLDGGCGPTGKTAYDAASAADPDLDYNEFDSDRNCLVDFFEIAFQGRGGNGDSQTHGYDNVWPHSGNLQDTYADANGQLGYVSNDQCRDRRERPLWWTDAFRTQLTTANKGDELRAFSRVGPYNVNPENGTTSVFAHEYGHSLGLPDYYSTDRTTGDYWELMATDGFQYMSVYARSQMGWVVPKRVPTLTTATMRDSKLDTHQIQAVGLDGRPYVVQGPNVHSGDAWYVELPHRTLFDKVPSGKFAFWSTAGNAFGCPGRTLDLRLNTTLQAPEGTALSLKMKSWYEIEWDFDYGFVLLSTDGGKTFTSLASKNGTTTPATFNPQNNVCQSKFGNGITGTTTAKDYPNNLVERTDGQYPAPVFIDDEFDVSACAGKSCMIRFAYSTDTGLAKRGWVVDDLSLTDGTRTYFSDNVEQERLGSYQSNKWLRFKAGPSPFDHGYYLELRDRTSNDYDSVGQGERHPIDFMPGISIWYTDMAHGDGNAGTDDPPAQLTIDPRREPEEEDPRLADASFFPLPGVNRFSDRAWLDNYVNLDGSEFGLKFDCFTMTVNSMQGLLSGAASASVTMATKPSRCVRVLGFSQGKPKPPAAKKLPATGLSGDGWLTWGVALMAAALVTRRGLLSAALTRLR